MGRVSLTTVLDHFCHLDTRIIVTLRRVPVKPPGARWTSVFLYTCCGCERSDVASSVGICDRHYLSSANHRGPKPIPGLGKGAFQCGDTGRPAGIIGLSMGPV